MKRIITTTILTVLVALGIAPAASAGWYAGPFYTRCGEGGGIGGKFTMWSTEGGNTRVHWGVTGGIATRFGVSGQKYVPTAYADINRNRYTSDSDQYATLTGKPGSVIIMAYWYRYKKNSAGTWVYQSRESCQMAGVTG